MGAPAIQIKSTAAIDIPWVHTFLYGPTGSGKTTFAATWPAPLFIAPMNEGSMLSLMDRSIPYIEIGSQADMNATLTFLEERHDQMQRALAKGNDDEAYELFPWQTIVTDALTHYGDLVVEAMTDGGTKMMDQKKWGFVANHFRNVHSRLRNLDVHAVFCALDKIVDGTSIGQPALIGSTAIKLPSACDIVAYMECRTDVPKGQEPKYRVNFRTSGAANFAARARFRGFPSHLDNASFSQIASLCGLGTDTDDN